MPQIVLDTQNGLTIPALTTAQKNAIASPNTGALVYDTTLGKVSDYNGSSWDVATVLSQFGASLTANGYQKLPGGLIMQWGSVSCSNSVSTAVSFPIAFPTICVAVNGTWNGALASTGYWASTTDLTLTGFNANIWAAPTSRNNALLGWVAFGY